MEQAKEKAKGSKAYKVRMKDGSHQMVQATDNETAMREAGANAVLAIRVISRNNRKQTKAAQFGTVCNCKWVETQKGRRYVVLGCRIHNPKGQGR